MDPERLLRIPARMQQLVDDGVIAGAVMLLARNGEVVLNEAVGYQDLDSRKPMTLDTIFQIQSMTKPVTATAAMILVEEGLMRINDRVAKYLPEFRKEPHSKITILHLLSHRSGLPHGHLSDQEPPTFSTLKEVVSGNARETLLFEPGQGRQYSNRGLETLGRVIEVVSGKPYDQFVNERILSPLSMTDTFFRTPRDKAERVATIYKFANGRLDRMDLDPTLAFTYPHSGAGLLSTAKDTFAFYQMTLEGGSYKGRRILSLAAVKTMTSLHSQFPPTARSSGEGLIWWLIAEPMGTRALPMQSEGAYGHGGYWGTLGWVDPTTGLVGVFMTHTFDASYRTDIGSKFAAMAAAAVED